jgi:hypothetical protein
MSTEPGAEDKSSSFSKPSTLDAHSHDSLEKLIALLADLEVTGVELPLSQASEPQALEINSTQALAPTSVADAQNANGSLTNGHIIDVSIAPSSQPLNPSVASPTNGALKKKRVLPSQEYSPRPLVVYPQHQYLYPHPQSSAH